MKKSTKISLLVGGILIVLISIIGVTFAFFSTGGVQGTANTFTSGCLNISLTDASKAINLTNAYPITDVEGLEGTSYDFTITNTCDTDANYSINLESLNEQTNSLGAEYIKVALSSDTVDNVISILSSNTSVTPEIDNAYEAHNLYTGTLGASETKTYHLKLWVDYDATVEEAANKVYSSKINVVATPETIVADTMEATFAFSDNTMTSTLTSNVTSATYCVTPDNICTPTTNASISNNGYSVDLFFASLDENVKKEAVSSPIGTLYVAVASNQMVCTKLNGTSKIICSNPEEAGYDELVADNTVDNNLRYIGVAPNNYVLFNNELWRIIGIMNNVEKADGTTESLVKIIRDESIGDYLWDNKPRGTGSATSTGGSNDWSDSALQIVLNEGAYYNRTSGTCPSGQNGATTNCDFSSTGLTEEAKDMIETVTWKLGGSTKDEDVTASMFYEKERGTEVYTGRPTEWVGEVGLMYPSDYGYATSGHTTTNRETCLSKELSDWISLNYAVCTTTDWFYDYNLDQDQWTLTPRSSSSDVAFSVDRMGNVVGYAAAGATIAVRPSVYLKSNVAISGGTGTSTDPYTLILN